MATDPVCGMTVDEKRRPPRLTIRVRHIISVRPTVIKPSPRRRRNTLRQTHPPDPGTSTAGNTTTVNGTRGYDPALPSTHVIVSRTQRRPRRRASVGLCHAVEVDIAFGS